jgi:hypothetical protein
MKFLQTIADADVAALQEKDKTYGSSWKKRGGVGAFMMLARKWDRIETQTFPHRYDIFKAIVSIDGFMDDILDLRRYLMLVQNEMMERNHQLQLELVINEGEPITATDAINDAGER